MSHAVAAKVPRTEEERLPPRHEDTKEKRSLKHRGTEKTDSWRSHFILLIMFILSKKDSHAKPRRGFASNFLGAFASLCDLFFVCLRSINDAEESMIGSKQNNKVTRYL
ncbi:MAG: hypothetical protein COA78_26405 [Blastopirellula sp.]|nr:MAG: hypothetical protein COA78_26405 [Blastopirellula sp.]